MHTLPGCKYYIYLLINIDIKDKNKWKKLNGSVINVFRDESSIE